jgi:small subunit ribosomal protein S13
VARVANVNIPQRKRVVIALTYIYGIGLHVSQRICEKIGLDPSKRVEVLTEDELVSLRKVIETDCKIEGDLRREVSLNIKLKKDIKCYQGLRHSNKLPVRGQNTHSNARTWKGKAVAIAGKKKASSKK